MLILVVACGGGAVTPAPTFGVNTPTDLRELTSEVFAGVMPKRSRRSAGCLEGVIVSGAWELDDRARYDPAVPARSPSAFRQPRPQLEISIVHEIAHHVEFACPQDEGTRRGFMAAQGLADDADWFDGASWETTPSEQWASAVVLHVLGRPDERARAPMTARAMEIVEAWAVGS